jgi:hypothetical protein
MRRLLLLAGIVLLIALFAACAQHEDPKNVVEAYFTAAVAGDADKMRSISCDEWEAQADRQAQSFRTVQSTLQGMQCGKSGEDGSYTLVTCQGAIVMDYNGEQREFPLETYRVIQEDGTWHFCGEA